MDMPHTKRLVVGCSHDRGDDIGGKDRAAAPATSVDGTDIVRRLLPTRPRCSFMLVVTCSLPWQVEAGRWQVERFTEKESTSSSFPSPSMDS